MRIGLVDVDGRNFPNLALMKISAWHKGMGDTVEWYDPMFSGHFDKVYLSKVFSFTPDFDYPIDADEVERGGTGYCISLVDGKEVFDQSKNKNLAPPWSISTPTTPSIPNSRRTRPTASFRGVVPVVATFASWRRRKAGVP